jgi:CheY-like chemotaxis protein
MGGEIDRAGRYTDSQADGCGAATQATLDHLAVAKPVAALGWPDDDRVLRSREAMVSLRVLIVDDDPLYARRARKLLGSAYDLRIARSCAEALREVELASPDVVVLEMFPDNTDAFRLLDDLRARMAPGPVSVIFLSRGPGSATRYCTDHDTFFGVVSRDSGPEALCDALLEATQSSTAVSTSAA